MSRKRPNASLEKISLICSRIGFVLYLVGNLILYFFKKIRLITFFIGIGLALLIVLSFFIFQPLPENKETNPKVKLYIPSGATFRQVTDSLQKHNLLKHRQLFLLLGKITEKEKNIRAGFFKVPRGLSEWQLLNYLESAPDMQFKVTLPEGISSYEMASILKKVIDIDSSRFISLVHDSTFASQLAPETSSLEGYLLPETYFFHWQTREVEIIQHMVSKTLKIFKPDSIQEKLKELTWTRKEVLTLASIIEGEVVVDSERVFISSVYHNRLRLGWPLQADPTIQFAIPGPPRRLLNGDLEIDSPYNTYQHRGLPPGPINNPGKKSIMAALYPADTKYIYLVATGDGGHKFSKTLQEHNYWKARFDEVRRRVRRQENEKNNEN